MPDLAAEDEMNGAVDELGAFEDVNFRRNF